MWFPTRTGVYNQPGYARDIGIILFSQHYNYDFSHDVDIFTPSIEQLKNEGV